jgi:hypothetical protein
MYMRGLKIKKQQLRNDYFMKSVYMQLNWRYDYSSCFDISSYVKTCLSHSLFVYTVSLSHSLFVYTVSNRN